MVFVREAAARPANVRRLYHLQRGDDVVADAPRIRNWGTRTDPYALINAVAEVLGKLAEDIAINLRSGLRHVNRQVNLLCGHEGWSYGHSYKSENDKKRTHDK